MFAAQGTSHCRSALTMAAGVGAALALLVAAPTKASEPVKITVFDFELRDTSAGGGMFGEDAVDAANLKAATDEARRMLAASGRYDIVDPDGAAGEVTSAGGVQHCNGCEGALAKKLGADQAMVGLFTRLNRTEYTLQILVRDANTGAILSNDFSGLRMGANYAWPRGVKWLMDNRILAASQRPQ